VSNGCRRSQVRRARRATKLARRQALSNGQLRYSIKLPPALDKPRVNRRDYYTAKGYFDALCEREAGEYIFKSVSGVNGIAVLRTPVRPW